MSVAKMAASIFEAYNRRIARLEAQNRDLYKELDQIAEQRAKTITGLYRVETYPPNPQSYSVVLRPIVSNVNFPDDTITRNPGRMEKNIIAQKIAEDLTNRILHDWGLSKSYD